MFIKDIKYTQLNQFIENQFSNLGDWHKVRKFHFFPNMTEDNAIDTLRIFTSLTAEDLDKRIWNEIIDEFEKREKKHEVVKLGKTIFNDAKIPADSYSAWQLYKNNLIQKKWSPDSVKSIEKSSFEILRNLSPNTVESGPIKGLVVGNVQSGKTANMAGLMAMAADNGFNYFIILSGVIENLRQQTANRIYSDMNTGGKGHLHWHQVDNPSLRSKLPEHNISNFNLGDGSKDKYFTVCLKNSTRLNSLIRWLYDDKNKAKQLKVLIIDDEADQASMNTKKIEEEDQTAINRLILELVNTKYVRGMNYIAYTATPYANILNETGENTLYPKDFITLLETSEDYIGPKQIFGTENPERSPQVDIVRDISIADAEKIQEAQREGKEVPLVKSLKDSVHWFILSVAAMRALDYRKPISMLIHTSFRIADHKSIATEVGKYLYSFKKDYNKIKFQLKNMYENESLDFKRSHFLQGMKDYSTVDGVPDYPTWEEVERYIERIVRLEDDEFISHIPIGEGGQPEYHKGFHLVIDNSKAKADNQIVRLVYPKKTMNTAPAFIVVGGNTLSRGLTLEGLTTTYFLRTTNQADTLMQMARWFGYRKGYEIFPRIWLDSNALERYHFLSQMNEELREEIAWYARNGLSPSEYAPRVKNSANHKLIRITSSNKMQSAEPKEYDFAGFNSQTIYFENDERSLKHNLTHTQKFLNSLPEPEIKKSKMLWKNVSVELISDFLKDYEVCNKDIKMSNLPALIEWAQKNAGELSDWNIILSSIGDIKETRDTDNSEWEIHGYSPKSVRRTKLLKRSDQQTANIGALRTPEDLLADIDEELTKEEKSTTKILDVRLIREKYGYGNVPQLIIYKIDKGSDERENGNEEGNRTPLNFPQDVIGINVMIPGNSKGSQLATYISAKIVVKNDDEENYSEESDDDED